MTAATRVLVLLALFGVSSVATADIDVYSFSSEDNREQYTDLTRELRCPKCQNQDIADSNAPIAQDMRREVHRLTEEGKTKEDIVAYMVERFGDFVRYNPRVAPSTYLLWYGPYVLVILGVMIVFVMAKRRRQGQSPTRENTALSSEDKARLDALLNESSEKDSHKEQEESK